MSAAPPLWICPRCGRSFANVNQTHTCAEIDGHLVLARRVDSPRFRKIEVYSPRNVVHTFRLTTPDQVDDEFAALLAEAYRVGEQRHRDRP